MVRKKRAEEIEEEKGGERSMVREKEGDLRKEVGGRKNRIRTTLKNIVASEFTDHLSSQLLFCLHRSAIILIRQ